LCAFAHIPAFLRGWECMAWIVWLPRHHSRVHRLEITGCFNSCPLCIYKNKAKNCSCFRSFLLVGLSQWHYSFYAKKQIICARSITAAIVMLLHCSFTMFKVSTAHSIPFIYFCDEMRKEKKKTINPFLHISLATVHIILLPLSFYNVVIVKSFNRENTRLRKNN
jgi:hypothetical protein